MGALGQDLRFGARTVARHPGTAAVAVLCLALGIGANTAIFTVAHRMLLEPLPYGEPAELVSIYTSLAGADPRADLQHSLLSEPEIEDLRAQVGSLERLFAYALVDGNVQYEPGASPERVVTLVADTSAFTTLEVEPALGRDFLPDEGRAGNEYVVILSHELWVERYDASPAVLGDTLWIDTEPHTIVGVAPADFRPPFHREAKLFAPLALYPTMRQPRSNHYLRAIGRLHQGVRLDGLQAELDALAAELRAREAALYPDPEAFALRAVSLRDDLLGSVRPALIMLSIAVALVLLIASANVASLLLARGVARERELALRRALGAGRRRIVEQLLLESAVLAVLGGLGGLLVALWGIDLLVALAPTGIPQFTVVELDWTCMAFALGLSLATGLLSGALPALQASGVGIYAVLKDSGDGRATTGRSGRQLRNGLVALEIALALVLLVGAGLMTKSLQRMAAADLGFAPARLVTMRLKLPPARYASQLERIDLYDALLERLRHVREVTGLGAVSHVPLGGLGNTNSVALEGFASERPVEAEVRALGGDYFTAMGIPLREGRSFGARDPGGEERVVIIDELLAARFGPPGEALGEHLRLSDSDDWLTIVGVVGHVAHEGVASSDRPQLYLSYAYKPPVLMTLILRTGRAPGDLAEAVQRELFRLDPAVPIYDVKTMDERIADSLEVPRFSTLLLGLFAQLALLLAIIGIYAVLSFNVAQRTREIGIRIALGAQPAQVVRLIVRQGMTVALLGVGIGIAVSAVLAHGLSGLLYGVATHDPLIYASAVAAVLLTALAACYLAARRAIRIDPIDALRAE